jgi:peptidase E
MRTIIAFGGGGFAMEPDNPRLDQYILSRARRRRPRVCFLPTASGDSHGFTLRFYRAFSQHDCIPSDLNLTGGGGVDRRPANTADIPAFLADQDVLYVGGGNTANMLALWRTHGIDRELRTAWEAGTVLCGLSAGMICWFASSVTDSFGRLAPLHDGLGFLPYSACPHYDGDPQRRPTFHRLIREGLQAGYAADDGAALVFDDHELVEVVSSRPQATGYFVERREAEVVETCLPARYL